MQIQEWAATIVATIVAAAYFLFGPLDPTATIFVTMLILDYVTGVMVACHQRKFSFSMSIDGLNKKVGILILAIVVNRLGVTMGEAGPVFRSGILLAYVVHEGLSLIRNLRLLGVWVPPQLGDALTALHSSAGAAGQERTAVAVAIATAPEPHAEAAQHGEGQTA